jgi:cell division protease FtsH
MAIDAWLPVAFKVPDGEQIRIALQDGLDWQIYETRASGRILIARSQLARRWFEAGIIHQGQMQEFSFGTDEYFALSSGLDYMLTSIDDCRSPDNKNEALSFAESFRVTRDIDSESPLQDAIYVEKISRLLPTYSLSARVNDDIVFGSWLTGGVPVSVQSFRRLRSLMSWLGAPHLRDVVVKGGFQVNEKIVSQKPVTQYSQDDDFPKNNEADSLAQQIPVRFTLAGRPELEQFFNEHIVDIIENDICYKALGIDFPSAVILHGPPGCGKTFAVEKLVDYLGWPSFQIDSSSVASPYIHDTSKKIAEVFDKAMQNSPSVIVIDEMEAFLADRQAGGGSSHHRVEEVAEFLRRIPEAIQNHVLILAMTNRIEMIDPAIQRRGRFDHVVKVDMASEEEVRSLLSKLVSDLPCEDNVDVTELAQQLAGRPLSDVAFAVREGARLAARAGKDKLDQASLQQAMGVNSTRKKKEKSSRIGFI